MPTQRAHGGAAVQPINLTSPAFQGLNTADSGSLLGPEWATTLTNAVFDDEGRPTTRNGWVSGTTTVYDGTEKLIKRIHEYIQADGTAEVISATDDNILSGLVDLSDATASIDGSLSISDGNIRFANLDDACFAFGIGTAGIPAKYTGSGTFGDITVSTGTAPTGTVGTAAYGRLWCFDTDGKTLRYSALLDETKWAAADGGGSVDFSRAWPEGTDEAVAITELGGELIVFGRRSIVRVADATPSTLGLDPTEMYVVDTIPGVGALSQFAITKVGGDLWFLSDGGIRSLQREIIQRSASVGNPSDNIQPDIKQAIANESTLDDITLMHSPKEEFVLAIFPTSKRAFYFDSSQPLQDGSHKATIWSVALQTAMYRPSDRTIKASLSVDGAGSTTGEIYNYSGFADDGESYNFEYESGWLDLGQEAAAFLKYVKKFGTVVFTASDTAVTHTLKYDFNEAGYASAQLSATGGAAAEYGISEYTDGGGAGIGYIDPNNTALGESEYSGTSLQLQTLSAPGAGGGQYIKVGLSVDNSGAEFAVQQINLFAKIGRMAH